MNQALAFMVYHAANLMDILLKLGYWSTIQAMKSVIMSDIGVGRGSPSAKVKVIKVNNNNIDFLPLFTIPDFANNTDCKGNNYLQYMFKKKKYIHQMFYTRRTLI